MDCRAHAAAPVDHERAMLLDEGLVTLELRARRFREELRQDRSARVIELDVNGVWLAAMPTASNHADPSPDPSESGRPYPGKRQKR